MTPYELVAAGVHPVVKSRASGAHYSAGDVYPMVPGVDAVACDADGRLVYTGWVPEPWGTMAERLSAPFGAPLPEGADPLAVAAGMNPAMSGWLPLAARAEEVGALGTVLVLGATGMAGGLAVQAARALGAERVVAAGRSVAALDRLAAEGAVVASLAGVDDDRAAVADVLAAALDGHAPSIVLDFLWGPVAEAAFAALGRSRGSDERADIAYVQIGSMAGPDASVPAALLRSRRLRLAGSGLGSIRRERLIATLPHVMQAIADGALTPQAVPFGFEDAAAAWAYTGPGRAVLVPAA
ncbi:zinc-binding alcohol dehydrogenase family protein [Schumannella soli]|uniref:Zinc-binding alcohol dehydrogenase family protein n=1 Tax=Schumannella soli TaxID=2590779 RepID=A0A506Y7U2_9MICO|nr:zinc-binding alcohol dehydrogenase family protein [Schumannella soli]